MASKQNSYGKRAIETIDLTGSDDAPFNPQPRKISRSDPTEDIAQTQPSQTQRDNLEAWDDEDDADNIIILSQDGNDAATESYELYGKYR